ncbi:hypothetical protein, partial [Klebsiella pneumoniae]|uniref:hypothetical protein n=1 Tax=Klebsiella pneumoniae TaxID=573 RepID=UPI000E347EF2
LKMPAFEWVHVQLHQQKGMISLSPPTICNSATDISPPAMRLLIIIAAYFIFKEAIQFLAEKSKHLAYAPDHSFTVIP